METNEEHLIWSDDIGNLEDWEDDEGNQMSYEEAVECNFSYLDDERINLDIEAGGEILCIADLGLWNGRRSAFKTVGDRINDILHSRIDGSMSFNKWYSDGKDICQDESHHDGTNHYVYRVLRGKNKEEQIENFEAFLDGPDTPERREEYTSSLLPAVAAVYGW